MDELLLERLSKLIRKQLKPHLEEYPNYSRGAVTYSGPDTLKPGCYYLMGLNPGEDDSNSELKDWNFPPINWSAYANQCWRRHNDAHCQHMRTDVIAEPVRHQQQVQNLAGVLNLNLYTIFSANAIFVASRDARVLPNIEGLWKACWPVHREFLSLVLPRYIICLGNGTMNSSYSFLRKEAGYPREEPDEKAPKKKYHPWKMFNATFDLGNGKIHACRVVGLPHPSRHFFGDLRDNWLLFKKAESGFAERK